MYGTIGRVGQPGQPGRAGPIGEKGNSVQAVGVYWLCEFYVVLKQGEKGDSGKDGNHGLKGVKGTKGDTGVKGADGMLNCVYIVCGKCVHAYVCVRSSYTVMLQLYIIIITSGTVIHKLY